MNLSHAQKVINRSHARQYALWYANNNRPGWAPERVSKQFLDALDSKVRELVRGAIERHPSGNKTIKNLF